MPGQSQKLVLKGDIPADAAPGEMYAFVSISTAPVVNGTMAIQSAVDVLVALLVTGGEITRNGEIESLEVTEPISPGQQNISLTFKNTGDYRYRADAEVLLESKDGKILGNASESSFNSILPGLSRLFELKMKPGGALKPGTYYMNATVRLPDGPVLGRKMAEFNV